MAEPNGWIYPRDTKAGLRYDVIVEALDEDNMRRRRRRTFTTMREAKAGLAQMLAEARAGLTARRTAITLADAVAAWLETVRARRAEATFVSAELTARLHVLPDLGRIRVAAITPARVQRHYADLRARGVGARTQQLAHMVLSQTLRYAVRMGWTTRDVAALADTPQRTVQEIRIHDTRHTAATHMLAAGMQPHVVAEYLGHSVAVLLRTYAHVLQGQRTAVAAQVEALYFGDTTHDGGKTSKFTSINPEVSHDT